MAVNPPWAERELSNAFGAGSRGDSGGVFQTLASRGDDFIMHHAAAPARQVFLNDDFDDGELAAALRGSLVRSRWRGTGWMPFVPSWSSDPSGRHGRMRTGSE